MAWEYLMQWGSWRHTDGHRCLISESQFQGPDMRCPVCGGAGPLSETVRINLPGRPFEQATAAEAAALFPATLSYVSNNVFPPMRVPHDLDSDTVWVKLDAGSPPEPEPEPMIFPTPPSGDPYGVRQRLRAAADRLRAKRQPEPEPEPEPVPLGARRYDFED